MTINIQMKLVGKVINGKTFQMSGYLITTNILAKIGELLLFDLYNLNFK